MQRLLFMASAVLIVAAGCTSIDHGAGPQEPCLTARMIVPHTIGSGQPLPVVVILPEVEPCSAGWETFTIGSEGRSLNPDRVSVKRGAGSLSTSISGAGTVNLSLCQSSGACLTVAAILIEDDPTVRILSGVLSGGDLVWDSTAIIRLTSDVTVPAGTALTIGPGVRVELVYFVNIDVSGDIFCQGTQDRPILFTSVSPGRPWGGIQHRGSTGFYRYAFFTNGGGDSSRAFGHSGSQAVLGGQGCRLTLDNVYIIDNPGKAMGISSGVVEMRSSLVSRCDTGGELVGTLATIEECHFLDMPCDDEREVDDDNDALYLNGPWSGGECATLVRGCVFATGKDDGIDHNNAIVEVSGCIIEDFDNEGLAASNGNRARLFNTLVMNCEQGVEAGYGAPEVTVNHCLVIGNQTGVRFGDWYNRPCSGSITVINSISTGNSGYNVWNWVLLSEAPREGAITVTYSIVNQPPYDEGEGCQTGEPRFDGDYRLRPGSPGRGAAADGLDMGLL